MKLVVFDKELSFDNPIRLIDLLPKDNVRYIAAKVNNRIRELNYYVSDDATIEFLDLTNVEAVVMYQTTLRFVIDMALKSIYPKGRIIFNHSVSRSFFASVSGIGRPVNTQFLTELNSKIKEIIDADYPISRKTVTKKEAEDYYSKNGYKDKTRVLKYRTEDDVHMYECNGFLNYMFGYMLPSTKYLTDYKLRIYSPGFIVQYPRSECGGKIPEFEDAPTFGQALREANIWGNIIDGSYISEMNKIIEDKRSIEFINLCETRHNNMLAELGERIKADIDDIRLIAVAGPSSSGKTTFTNRLRIELMSRGINPVMISIDDYYLGKEFAPKDIDGNPDLEHIEALDIDYFDHQMMSLIQGEEVILPVFNFETGKREEGRKVKLGKNQPIMIEGIHALNDRLTSSIPSHQKYKIYISPQAQLHIDDANPISMADIRLIRRIVRDYQFRNYPAEGTLKMWASVRRGEFRWIYPYQEKANYVFNSELTYELCVLKKYALKLLKDIPSDSEYYIQANRLVKFLKYFEDIDDKWVPCNSILREFLGGSMFYPDQVSMSEKNK